MPTTTEEVQKLVGIILRHFLPEVGQTHKLRDDPELRRIPHHQLRRFVQALAWIGLLEKWGATSGTTYRTSHLGYVVLVTLDETLPAKARDQSNPRIR